MKTLVVHPWSQTVIDAADGVIVVNVTDAEAELPDTDIIAIATNRGLLIPSKGN